MKKLIATLALAIAFAAAPKESSAVPMGQIYQEIQGMTPEGASFYTIAYYQIPYRFVAFMQAMDSFGFSNFFADDSSMYAGL